MYRIVREKKNIHSRKQTHTHTGIISTFDLLYLYIDFVECVTWLTNISHCVRNLWVLIKLFSKSRKCQQQTLSWAYNRRGRKEVFENFKCIYGFLFLFGFGKIKKWKIAAFIFHFTISTKSVLFRLFVCLLVYL